MNSATPRSSYSSSDGKLQSVARLNRYRELLIRRSWWLVSGLGMGLLAGVLLWSSQPRTFVSVGRMIVSIKLAIPEGSVYSEELGNFLGTQAALMQSRVVMERAHSAIAGHPSGASQPASLRVTVSPKTSIFILEASGSDPNYVQSFLQAAMEEYIKLKKEMRAQTSDTTVAGLTEQVLRLEKELSEAQENLMQFQRSNSVVLLQEQGNIAGNYLAALHQRLAAAEAEEAQLQSLTSDPGFDARLEVLSAFCPAPNPNGHAGSVFQYTQSFTSDYLKTRQQLLLLKAQETDLAQYLKPKHPKMLAISEEVGRCERLLAIIAQQNATVLQAQQSSLARQILGLEENISEWNTKAVEINQKAADYQRLRVNEQRVQALYDRLLGTLQTLDVNKEISPESVTVLEKASSPFSDLRQPLRQLVIASVVALVVSIGLVLLVDHLDDRVNSFVELQQWFTEPILAQIPRQVASGKNGAIPLLDRQDARFAFAEAYRNLRSSLLYSASQNHQPKTLLLTSSIPNEGKSLTAANLAIILAQADARVLLVDADLRKGALHRKLGLSAQAGLSGVLEGNCPWREAVAATSYSNLWLLSCGDTSAASSELFLRPQVREFLTEAGAAYDYVILDTPPVMAADDVPSLAPQADAVLFVVRAEHTSVRTGCAALDLLYSRGASVLGIIFNAVRPTNADYYSYEGYHRCPRLNGLRPKREAVENLS